MIAFDFLGRREHCLKQGAERRRSLTKAPHRLSSKRQVARLPVRTRSAHFVIPVCPVSSWVSGTVQVVTAISLPTNQEMRFRPGGTMDISRWWSGAKPPELDKNGFASRQGRRTGMRSIANPGPASFQGACSCWGVSGGYASLHHRLMSAAPPAQRLVGILMAHAPHTVPLVTQYFSNFFC